MKGNMMRSVKNDPILTFDFAPHGKKTDPVIFTNPEEIISTWNLVEVSHCLDKIQLAVNNGFYVAGYISYEALYAFINQTDKNPEISMPLIWFGVFKKRPNPLREEKLGEYFVEDWKLTQTKNEYEHAFHTIKEAIERQETRQVNYTVQFEANFTGCAYSYYEQLKQAQQSNYSAYIDIGDYQILSTSPEMFFQLQNGVITAKPMKGTIHRGKTFEEDLTNQQWLAHSEKNKLENDLITELMVDEFKHITDEATIQVVNPYHVEKYPTVFQMTSTITAKVLPELSALDILKTLFPCGSISGVPKKKTLELISRLEKHPRDVYCGAIGYITPNHEAIFNVPIRTVVIDPKQSNARYGAGGAITKYSNLEEEFAEVKTKAKILHQKHEPFQLLETLGLRNGNFIVLKEHLQRLKKSAAYFDFEVNMDTIKHKLLQYKDIHKEGEWRVRLLVDKAGEVNIKINQLKQADHLQVGLAKAPIDKENIFLYHKTTNRSVYEEHMREVDGLFDVLLWNVDHEVTEFTIGNIIVELDGELITPPVDCGLLPGTFRQKLLNEGNVKEAIVLREDLHKCANIWLINSVREWVPVQLVN